MNEVELYKVMMHFGGEDTLWFDMDEEEAGRALDAWLAGGHRGFPGYEDGEIYYVDMRSVRMIHVSKIEDSE